jgi:transcriptional regulator with XRE-family HTH domain
MFKQNFINFCNKKGESPSFVCRQVGLAPATFSCWDENSIPRQATLQRIADYFGITPEDLLRDPAEKVAAPAEPAPTSPLSAEFYDLVDQLTLKELREIQAIMEDKIKNRK